MLSQGSCKYLKSKQFYNIKKGKKQVNSRIKRLRNPL